MKVQIKDLKPNPYRDMDNYPIDQDKIETLKASIEQTGFWDNILARKINGEIQIAYGHHRLVVLRQVMDPDDEVDIPVKDLSDAVMIQIMANENMDEWKTTVAVINETVRVTKQFLKKHPEEIKTPFPQWKVDYNRSPLAFQISEFLGWGEKLIYNSLESLKMIDKGTLDKEAIEELPTVRHATEFTSAMKKDPMPKEKQRRMAKEISEADKKVPSREIYTKVLEEKWKPEKKDTMEIRIEKERKKRILTMENLLRDNLSTSSDFLDALQKLIRIMDELGDDMIIADKLLRVQVTANFQRLHELLTDLLKNEKYR